jgi:5,10-methylenetetrahydromethanopterin reductase
MNIGFMCAMASNGVAPLEDLIREIRAGEALGLHQAWLAQVFSTDAITLLALAARETRTIRLGTAVTPSFPRHPASLAIQALTTSAAAGGRFDLGIGVSHKVVIEDMFGIAHERPVAHMREYLGVLLPLMRGEVCGHDGELYRVHARLNVPDALPVPVLLAALNPRMLRIAGTVADGTTTWMTGLRTLESLTVPVINEAARTADRPAPRIVAGVPVVLTRNVDAAREKLARRMDVYGHIPAYARMLEREGVNHPADLALVGDEAELRAELARLGAVGVTDCNAFCMPVEDDAVERTKAFLASLC